MNIDELVREQFRMDTNCTPECEEQYRIMINKSRRISGARLFGQISPFFRAIIYLGDMYMMCDERLFDWATLQYSNFSPEWFCLFPNLKKLDDKLREYGHGVLDTHIYFLPDESFEGYDFDCPYEVRWYDRDGIMAVRGNAFHNALLYCPDCPDEIAVAALDNNGVEIAMAGASSDGKNMWQIGIDVSEPYRQKGLAVYLTTLLKEKILSIGKVPFYGTSESHSISRNVAVKAGFVPAWCEIYSATLDNIK